MSSSREVTPARGDFPASPGSTSSATLTTAGVERLVRSVIVDRGLPCALLSVTGAPVGWNVMVRAGTWAMIRFAVSSQRPIAARAAIQDLLEAEL
jgi:hypothetical protein